MMHSLHDIEQTLSMLPPDVQTNLIAPLTSLHAELSGLLFIALLLAQMHPWPVAMWLMAPAGVRFIPRHPCPVSSSGMAEDVPASQFTLVSAPLNLGFGDERHMEANDFS